MASIIRSRPSAGVLVLLGLIGLAFVVALVRYTLGLGAISNLSDAYPWGLWISFDLLCGVALAAGAFTTASAVYIFGLEEFRPILRPAILTGFLGYLMVIVALLVDLGRPERIWHLMIHWNPESVLFEVGWCVMLYTAVLALEFSPLLFERLGWRIPLAIIHRLTIVFVLLGTLLSTLHQSSLGSLFLAMPGKVQPLWFSPFLPLYFFLTAVAVGPAMVIVESSISARVFKRSLESELIGKLARAIPFALGAYLLVKIYDLSASGKWASAFQDGMSLLFWIEMIGGVILPIVLFSLPAVRQDGSRLLAAALLVVGGLILNRFDVSLIGWARPIDSWYFPHWMELAITVGIVAGGVIAYGLVARASALYAEPRDEKHRVVNRKASMQHYSRVLDELRQRVAIRSECQDWISLYMDLLAAQARVADQLTRMDVRAMRVRPRLSAGLPLLDPKDFYADRTLFVRLGHEICSIVGRHRSELATPLDSICARFDEARAPNVVWASLLSGGQARRGEEDEWRHSLLAFVNSQALHPFLRMYAEAFWPYVEEDIWYRPICPVCGGEPDFAALEKITGARRLLCSHCDAEWVFWRTECPFCASADPTDQQYSISEDRIYRLYFCDACGRYLKTIDLREVADERLLPAERLLTLPMDVAALDVRQLTAKEG